MDPELLEVWKDITIAAVRSGKGWSESCATADELMIRYAERRAKIPVVPPLELPVIEEPPMRVTFDS